MYLFDGGYADIKNEVLTYHYYVKDHLGNHRIVQNEKGKVEATYNYYPFGNTFDHFGELYASSIIQPYRYNGKEYDSMYGLEMYDYGARLYDPLVGRWFSIDPLSEKYYSISPYAYCANNPIMLIDPDGMKFDNASMSIINALLALVDKNENKIDEKIARLQGKLNDSELSGKKINKINREISELNSQRADFENVRSEINLLIESDQNYSIKRDPSLYSVDMFGSADVSGTSCYDGVTSTFVISLGDTEAWGLVAHELKHAYQFETGAFSNGLVGYPFYDQNDELEAYQRGALFDSKQNFSSLPSRYSKLQAGPIDYTKIILGKKTWQDIANSFSAAFRVNGKTYIGINYNNKLF